MSRASSTLRVPRWIQVSGQPAGGPSQEILGVVYKNGYKRYRRVSILKCYLFFLGRTAGRLFQKNRHFNSYDFFFISPVLRFAVKSVDHREIFKKFLK